MYSRRILYTVQYTLYNIHCTVYIIQCIMYCTQCTMYTLDRVNTRDKHNNLIPKVA